VDVTALSSHPPNSKFPNVLGICAPGGKKIVAAYADHSFYAWDVQDVKRVSKMLLKAITIESNGLSRKIKYFFVKTHPQKKKFNQRVDTLHELVLHSCSSLLLRRWACLILGCATQAVFGMLHWVQPNPEAHLSRFYIGPHS
jgi:hypothetical protein